MLFIHKMDNNINERGCLFHNSHLVQIISWYGIDAFNSQNTHSEEHKHVIYCIFGIK